MYIISTTSCGRSRRRKGNDHACCASSLDEALRFFWTGIESVGLTVGTGTLGAGFDMEGEVVFLETFLEELLIREAMLRDLDVDRSSGTCSEVIVVFS